LSFKSFSAREEPINPATPVINALGFIFVSLTIIGALIYTFFHRRRFTRT